MTQQRRGYDEGLKINNLLLAVVGVPFVIIGGAANYFLYDLNRKVDRLVEGQVKNRDQISAVTTSMAVLTIRVDTLTTKLDNHIKNHGR